MDKYKEILSIEYPSEKSEYYSDSEDNFNIQNGGAVTSKPNGGFPPIYICDSREQTKENTGNREYSTHKTAISIKDIMKKRISNIKSLK